MPDSLEKVLKLLIKTGILPKKKKRKNRKSKRVSKKQLLENNIRQINSNPISYGQPNLSYLSANNQIAFTENRNKQIDYENSFNDYLNPHIKRINDRIFNTENDVKDTNNNLIALENNAEFYVNDLYTRFDKFPLNNNLDRNITYLNDNEDVPTNTGKLVSQKASDNSNNITYDENDDETNILSPISQTSKTSQVSKLSSKSNAPPSSHKSSKNLVSPYKNPKVSFEGDGNNDNFSNIYASNDISNDVKQGINNPLLSIKNPKDLQTINPSKYNISSINLSETTLKEEPAPKKTNKKGDTRGTWDRIEKKREKLEQEKQKNNYRDIAEALKNNNKK